MKSRLKCLFSLALLMTSVNVYAQEVPTPGRGNAGKGAQTVSPTVSKSNDELISENIDVKRLNKIRIVQSTDNWTVNNIAVALSPGIRATVTIPLGPIGVDTGGSNRFGGPWGQYPIRIIDGAKSETVYVTGGTCSAGATNCTLIFKPFFSHSSSDYSLASATQGIQEAINDGCGLPAAIRDWANISGCHVIIPPRGKPYGRPKSYSEDYNIYASIFFHASQSKLSGEGAVINHYGRGPGLVVGFLTPVNADGSLVPGFPGSAPSNLAVDNTIEGISFRSASDHSGDPAYAGSLIASVAYSNSTHLNTIKTAAPHGLRSGDIVTVLFTDPTQFWGDIPSITVVDPNTFTYYRDSKSEWPVQTTPGVVALAYEPVLDNATGTSFLDLKESISWELGRFNNWFDFWDDERCLVRGFDNAGIPLNANINWTGSFFFSGGAHNLPLAKQQLAPVLTVTDSNITANHSNGFSFFNSNGLYVHDTVIQAQGLWQANVSNITGNYQGASFENIYTETGPSLNPIDPAKSPWAGMGNAGLIAGPSSGAALFSIRGASMGGSLPTYGDGPTQYLYSIMVNDLTTGVHSSPLPVMFGRANRSGTISVRWPRVADGRDRITYHVIRNLAPLGIVTANGGYIAPSITTCGGGTADACGAVAKDLPQCSGFRCTYSDDLTGTSSIAKELASQNYRGNFSFWPALGAVTSGAPIISDTEINTVGVGAHANTASAVPINYAARCRASTNVFGGFTSCATSTDTTNGTDSALLLNDYNLGKVNAKGRLNFMARGKPQELITLSDAETASTIATTGYRPDANALDAYIGLDGPKGGFAGNAAPVAFGSPLSISNYIGARPDNHEWKERLTFDSKSLKVPIDFQSGVGHEISGPELTKPSPPASGFQKAYFKAGRGLCTIDAKGMETCMGHRSTANTDAPDAMLNSENSPWFTAGRVEGTAVFSSSAKKASLFGVTLNLPTTTKHLTYSVVVSDPTATKYDIGIYSGTSGGTCTLLLHTGPNPGSTAMTAGYHTVNWKEGAVTLRPGRYYLAITASSTESVAALGGASNQLTFAGGTRSDNVGNVTVTNAGELDGKRTCPEDSYQTAGVPAFIVH